MGIYIPLSEIHFLNVAFDSLFSFSHLKEESLLDFSLYFSAIPHQGQCKPFWHSMQVVPGVPRIFFLPSWTPSTTAGGFQERRGLQQGRGRGRPLTELPPKEHLCMPAAIAQTSLLWKYNGECIQKWRDQSSSSSRRHVFQPLLQEQQPKRVPLHAAAASTQAFLLQKHSLQCKWIQKQGNWGSGSKRWSLGLCFLMLLSTILLSGWNWWWAGGGKGHPGVCPGPAPWVTA